MSRQKWFGGTLVVVPLVIGGLGSIVSPTNGQSVVAFDCEREAPPGCLPFGFPQCRDFRRLQDGMDINDAGEVVFADENGVYVEFLSSGKGIPFGVKRGVVGEIGDVFGDDTDFIRRMYSIQGVSLQRINEKGCVTFLTQVVATNNGLFGGCCCYVPRNCGGCSGPSGCFGGQSNAIMRGRVPNPFRPDCARQVLFDGGAATPREIHDFDILETKVGLDYRAVATLGPGGGEDDKVALIGPGYLQEVDYAIEGGGAPNGGTYAAGAGEAFQGITTGELEPLAFKAKLENAQTTHVLVSELHGTVVECDQLPNVFIAASPDSGMDRGCVNCFGSNPESSSVVHLVVTDQDNSVCVTNAGLLDALAETNAQDNSTMILLRENVAYESLGGDAFRFAGSPQRVSASPLTSITPACTIGNGVAVFRGTLDSTGDPAIFVSTGPCRVYVLAKKGDPLPSPHSGKNFVSFGDPRVNASGKAVFWAESDDQSCDSCDSGGLINCGGVFAYDLDTFLANQTDPCPADLDFNGDVGTTDMFILFALWGPCPPTGPCCGDFDQDGIVGSADFLTLLAEWGPCCD